ncbi:MAG: histidine triad nucleotide-binding protein [Holosporales bacterium]|jgi:diadenosine tetraphosphate (Ap4A) HIT family hydrolase|nr:histidine triad nucleotide-binding protein [Holosporales bacterium]
MYDPNNIFAKILRKELPATCVYEDDHVLAFKDIHPAAPIHVLVITKKAYSSFDDFSACANEQEIVLFWQGVYKTVQALRLSLQGYRLVTNIGTDGGQEVPHLHVHILAGKPLGTKVCV